MTDYTPTTGNVKNSYAWDIYSASFDDSRDAAFDRWLASVKAEAWDEGAAALYLSYTSEWPENPHRAAPSA